MNPTEYTAAAELTNNMDYDVIASRIVNDENFEHKPNSEMIDLLHASLGVVTESAELADAVKKHLFYGKEVDAVNLKEECGDILWYIAIICRRYSVSFEQLMADNIAKLRKRFPNRFTEHDANNRDTVNELSHIKATNAVPTDDV